MARKALVIDQVLAIMTDAGIPVGHIETFRQHAERIIEANQETDEDPATVVSGLGYVELTLNETRSQMTVTKARETGLMLIEAAEAAASEEMFVRLLELLGVDDAETQGHVLLALREIRHDARGAS